MRKECCHHRRDGGNNDGWDGERDRLRRWGGGNGTETDGVERKFRNHRHRRRYDVDNN